MTRLMMRMMVVALLSVWTNASRAEEAFAPYNATVHVDVDGDWVTVRADRAAVPDIVAALLHALGSQMRGHVLRADHITVNFRHVSGVDALHRLLAGQSFWLRYDRADRLRLVVLLGDNRNDRALSARHRAPAIVGDGWRIVDGLPAEKVDARLAKVLGVNEAPILALTDTAARHTDPAVRARALKAFVGALERDPRTQEELERTFTGFSDEQLVNLMRGKAGEQAVEFVAAALRATRSVTARERLHRVLVVLRQSSAEGHHGSTGLPEDVSHRTTIVPASR
jgi:hypothetical protein